MQNNFDATSCAERTAVAATTEKATQVLALGLQKDESRYRNSQNYDDYTEIWCPRLQVHNRCCYLKIPVEPGRFISAKRWIIAA